MPADSTTGNLDADVQIVGSPGFQKSLYDIWSAVSALDPNAGGDVAVVNSATSGKTKLAVTPDTDATLATALIGKNSKTFSDVVTAIGALPQTQFSGAVTNAGLSNIDTSINTLFTTTGIKVATMPSTAVTNAGLSNIDTAINALFTTTGIKVATMPSVGVTNAGLSNIDTSLNTLFTSTGIKVATLPDAANAVLSAVEDQTTHYLGVKDVAHAPVTGTLQSAATGTGVGTPLTVTGMKVVSFQVMSAAGTTSFTIDFEASVDGTNFVPSIVVTNDADISQSNIVSVSGTASYNQIFTYICAGKAKVQANISAITAGTGNVTVKAVAVA